MNKENEKVRRSFVADAMALQEVLEAMAKDASLQAALEQVVHCCINALKTNQTLFFAGNGGSAADAQHMAAEFVGRFVHDRRALPAIALTTDTSTLTAIGNDTGFDQIFSRQIEALGKKGDVLFAYSTSGKSANILKALQTAREKHMHVIGLTGECGGEMPPLCDYMLKVPSSTTARIQEGHLLLGHTLCGYIEKSFLL